MPKPRDGDLHKHTLNLFEGDYEKIQSYYPDTGAATIIRRLVRRFIQQVEAGSPSFDLEVKVDL